MPTLKPLPSRPRRLPQGRHLRPRDWKQQQHHRPFSIFVFSVIWEKAWNRGGVPRGWIQNRVLLQTLKKMRPPS